MAVTRETLVEHRQKHGVTYMISFLSSLIPLLSFGAVVWAFFGDLIVSNAELSHHTEYEQHVQTTDEFKKVNKSLDSILLLNLQGRIEKLLMAECTNPDMRDMLEETIRSLINQYNEISKTPYQRPTCAQLGALQ